MAPEHSVGPQFRYAPGERRPVEVLVFRVDPAHVDQFLRVDHEVWTLGEAASLDDGEIPFLSKEVWLNDQRPGEVTIVFVWPDKASWDAVGADAIQRRLTGEFEDRFTHPFELVREIHEEQSFGLHRWSRFERIDDDVAG